MPGLRGWIGMIGRLCTRTWAVPPLSKLVSTLIVIVRLLCSFKRPPCHIIVSWFFNEGICLKGSAVICQLWAILWFSQVMSVDKSRFSTFFSEKCLLPEYKRKKRKKGNKLREKLKIKNTWRQQESAGRQRAQLQHRQRPYSSVLALLPRTPSNVNYLLPESLKIR